MVKKLITFTMLIFIIFGLGIGVYFAISSKGQEVQQKVVNVESIFRTSTVTKYGNK